MKETIKLGIVLLIFTAVSAGVLAATNSITEPIIAEQERQKSFEAFSGMFADADDFQELDEGKLNEIQEKYSKVIEGHEALKGGSNIGYALKVVSGGYGGDVTTIVGISSEGHFTGIEVVSQSETPNLGDKIQSDEFKSSFVDKTLSEELNPVASPAAENEVLLLSGATISTNAVVTATSDARGAFAEFLSDGSIEIAEEEDPFESIFPEADEFTEVEDSLLADVTAAHEEVKEVHEALAGGEVVGYIFTTETNGYDGADMPMTIYTGISAEGTIEGMRLGENGETPNLGDKVGKEEFRTQFEGKAADEEVKADGVSGATQSSDGANKAVNKAREAYLEFFSN